MEWICFHKIQSSKSHLCGLRPRLCTAAVFPNQIDFRFLNFLPFHVSRSKSLLLKFENQSLCKQSSLFSAEMKRIPIAFIWIFVMSFIWNKHINSAKSTMERSSVWKEEIPLLEVGWTWFTNIVFLFFLFTKPIVEHWKNCFIGDFNLENCRFWQHTILVKCVTKIQD